MSHTRLVILVLLTLWLPVSAFAVSVTVTWDAVTANADGTPITDLAGYKVYRGVLNCTAQGPLALFTTLGTVTTFTDDTLPDTTPEVCYRLTAVDLTGNESVQSAQVMKVLAGTPLPPVTVPPPTNFTYANGTLSWTAVPGAAGYLLRVHEAGTLYDPCSSLAFCNEPGTLTATTVTLPLKPNTQYDAWIHSHDAAGVWGGLQGLSFTTAPDAVPPAVPKGLQLTEMGPDRIVITASKSDCVRVVTSTSGTTATRFKRTVTCAH